MNALVLDSGTSSYVSSATYAPVAVISGSAPKLVGAPVSSITRSAENSRSSFWPGTSVPSSYSWSQMEEPGTCIVTNASTATPTRSCNTATGATDYTIHLQLTDPTPTTVSTTAHVGVVQVDSNDNGSSRRRPTRLRGCGCSAFGCWGWDSLGECCFGSGCRDGYGLCCGRYRPVDRRERGLT